MTAAPGRRTQADAPPGRPRRRAAAKASTASAAMKVTVTASVARPAPRSVRPGSPRQRANAPVTSPNPSVWEIATEAAPTRAATDGSAPVPSQRWMPAS